MLQVFLCLLLPTVLAAQWFVGAGPTYHRPENPDYRAVNKPAFGGTALLMSRQYCQWWYGVRFEYSPLAPYDSLPPLHHGYIEGSFLAGEIRWFPWMPTDFPLYVSGTLGLSTIATKPATDFPGSVRGQVSALAMRSGLEEFSSTIRPAAGGFSTYRCATMHQMRSSVASTVLS